MNRRTEKHAETQPVVSVCMLTYNHMAFISQAIDSVLMQETDFAFELLVNDDCSTDGTTNIVRTYAEETPDVVRAFFHEENQFSQGKKALPELFRQARGKYIALLEGDDAWGDRQKLAQQVAFLESTPSCVLCYGNVNKIDASGNLLEERRVVPPESGRLSREEMVRCRQLIPTSTIVFRRPPDLDEWVGNVNRVLNGDSFLCAMLAQHGEAGYLDFSPSLYRQHGGGIYSSLCLDQRRAAKIQTLGEIYVRTVEPLRTWAASELSGVYRARTEHLRRKGRYRDALRNAASYLIFELGRGSVRRAGRAAWDGLRQVRKMVTRPRLIETDRQKAHPAGGGAA